MKFYSFIGLILISLLSLPARAQEQQVVVPYTLADRDRAIQIENQVSSLNARLSGIENRLGIVETRLELVESRLDRVEVKFDSLQRQMDDLKTLFFWGFGILISLFICMFGYMIWDRRTAMKPALV